MLWRMVQVGLRPDVHVMFSNTGKERPETLDFVNECSVRWNVPITWLEYRRRHLPKYRSPERAAVAARIRQASGRADLYLPHTPGVKEPGYKVVDYNTASRDGEPFDNMIDMNGLPNRTTRLCTAEMKIRVIKKRMLHLGYENWTVVLGLRADEPDRVARQRKPPPERWEHAMPLADAGVTEADVMAFWATQPFDLKLEQHEGNCDLCFLKSTAKRAAIVEKRPDLLSWWIRAEARSGDVFNRNSPPYVKLAVLPDAPSCTADDGGDCFCTD